ncbi:MULTISPECIES: proton-conducting transporter transmembrane domain-containing protein [Amycolatopsis]|uniref:Formate hydrogenlyase subunit 3/multisubunit Na+/H+ antiporter MnhD subunit n=1 Tax=Amycolatopsis echigonensis TaxID=2576905 RepID=A0A2N3WLF4_9PSEU|nr:MULTISPECIES: proton-conducting transporter membrane subunit [Amycolatopsis]MBB2500796.1 NADH/ubiquinone/plastoquinone (complex I) [Amycolatopsis echigonensis]MCG3751247.1 NADH/ubiquinone/plastoquinone (complex I) [Amycolatopsis sp. Poz14]PKV94711.1 formate hydrogenlyase subunit 3/multisubunit Na+/H+ antiporter MnhD subunit [Amycolatopsis niigatensis]
MTAVLIAALGLLGLALLADLVLGVRHAWARPLPYLLGAAAATLLTIVGAAGLTGHPIRLSLDAFLGFGAADLTVDRLSALFLVISFSVAVPVSLACADWAVRPHRVRARGLSCAYALAFASIAVIVTADHVFVFLFAWETLTVAFYLMTAHQRGCTATPAIVTIALGKVSGAALLVGLLLLAAQSRSFSFPSFTTLPHTGVRDAAYALLVLGFAVKVGLVPVHVWMPRGYRAAPGPLRAVMAGVAVNVGFYGLWRTLALLHQPPPWLAVVVLLLGGATALLGIAHATVQTDLAEVVAYSSVENAGLITVGYAVAMIGAAASMPPLIAVGLLAATLQTIAHALAKSLLFTATAGIEDATGTTELDDLRGVGHRLRFSGTGLAIGALTLAGLPLTAGFVSEWFLLEALMQQFRLGALGYTLPLAVTGALVALTAGFAAVAFVRIVGLTVLGPRGPRDAELARDTGPLGKLALTALGAGCLAVAAVAPLQVRVIAAGLGPIVPRDATGSAIKGPWVLQPVFPGFSILSPSWLAVVLPALLAGAGLLCLVFARGRMFAVRRVPAWRSATGGVEGENQYKPFAFTNPTRKVLANVLLTRAELRTVERQSGGRDDDPRPDAAGAHLGYTSDVVEAVEQFLYRPLLRPLRAAVRTAKRLQNGRLDAYVGYLLIAFVAVLALVLILA